jgi:hypothetical protein
MYEASESGEGLENYDIPPDSGGDYYDPRPIDSSPIHTGSTFKGNYAVEETEAVRQTEPTETAPDISDISEDRLAVSGIAGEVREPAQEPKHPKEPLEVIVDGSKRTIVNHNHPSELVQLALTTNNWVATGHKLTIDRYWADKPTNEEPKLFAKVTPVTHLMSENEHAAVQTEMELAQEVRQIISSDEAQLIARENGYESIDYVEPVVGVTDTTNPGNAHKTIIFPWQNGKSPNYKDTMSPDEAAEYLLATNITDRLRVLFQDNLIMPEDLASRQLIIDGSRIHLIDTEGYRKIKPTMAEGEIRQHPGTPEKDTTISQTQPSEQTIVDINGHAGVYAEARGSKGGEGPILQSSNIGLGLVVLWHPLTRQGLSLPLTSEPTEGFISELVSNSMGDEARRHVRAYIFGGDPPPMSGNINVPWNRKVEFALLRQKIRLIDLIPGDPNTVTLNTSTGAVVSTDENNNQRYPI